MKYEYEPKSGMIVEFFGRFFIWAFALVGFLHPAIHHELFEITLGIQIAIILSSVWVALPFILAWRKKEK